MEVPMIAAGVAVFGLIVALVLYKNINKQKIENETVADISQQIQDGAMAFLKAEYKYISIFVVIVGGLLFVNNGMETAIAFIAGAVASVVAGFSGMRAATSANGRTAMAAS
ncbi:MAG: sodium-translocating pyrophosphatase, partial [Euryarchaeota archaeon]|nr:sodium-translocating pyrophosphatase [Euryarchaeota archaeon]